jgi:hypothetical protein
VRLEPLGDAPLSLSALDGAAYAAALKARHVVPLHFEGWRHFTEGRAEAAAALSRDPVGAEVHWLKPGEAASFEI